MSAAIICQNLKKGNFTMERRKQEKYEDEASHPCPFHEPQE
jgi:hypothetical protein